MNLSNQAVFVKKYPRLLEQRVGDIFVSCDVEQSE